MANSPNAYEEYVTRQARLRQLRAAGWGLSLFESNQQVTAHIANALTGVSATGADVMPAIDAALARVADLESVPVVAPSLRR
jgi:hypothetical protein